MNSLNSKIKTQKVSVQFLQVNALSYVTLCVHLTAKIEMLTINYLSLFIQGRRFLQRARMFCVKCFCQLVHLVICVLQCAHRMSLNFCHVLFKIDKKAMKTSGMVARVINEVEIHCQLKHPSILEVYKHALLNPMFYIEQILKIICFFFLASCHSYFTSWRLYFRLSKACNFLNCFSQR